MNKQELLQELSTKISTGEISQGEVMSRFGFAPTAQAVPAKVSTKNSTPFSVTKMLYVIGAIIAVIGIVLFTFQIWYDIGAIGRIAITLGLGILITGIGSMLLKSKPDHDIGTVFHFIGGLLVPGGALVTLNEVVLDTVSLWPTTITFGIIFAFYLLLNRIHKTVVLTLFAIVNGTVFVYLIVNAITDGLFTNYTNLFAYLTMVIGVCYILLAYSFRAGSNERLVAPLNFLGFAAIQIAVFFKYANSFSYNYQYSYQASMWPTVLSLGLVSLFYLILNRKLKGFGITLLTIANATGFVYVFVQALLGGSFYAQGEIYAYLTMVIGASYLLIAYSFRGGWNSRLEEILNFIGTVGLLGAGFSRIYDSILWQSFFFILVMGGVMASVYLKSRSILGISTLFLIAFISYITSEYFADSIGWPISLIILGFIFIGLGYAAIAINKKYIAKQV